MDRRPNPDDRRAKRGHLTERARAAQKAARDAAIGADEKVAEILGPDRLAQLKSDVAKVIEAFGGAIPTAPPEV